LRVQEAADSIDVVGTPLAARLPRSIPGRAAMQLGEGEAVVFQTASSAFPWPRAEGTRVRVLIPGTARDRWDSDAPAQAVVLAEAVRRAATVAGTAPPHRPWL